jgi:SAM-dependent MidA family methyltransferase
LPAPEPAECERVAPLLERIADEIDAHGGALPFPRYVELALYAPGLGYYSGPTPKLGAAGDFVTAPELSPLFGRCVARQCAEVLDALGGGDILEFGAGTGSLAAETLLALDALGSTPRRYLLLEVSGPLRARQARTLAARAPALADRVQWLEALPAARFDGVVLANEVVDAIPFHRVRREPDGVSELYVGLAGGRFAWQAGPPSSPSLAQRMRQVEEGLGSALPPGYQTEVAPAREAWVRTVGGLLRRGAVIVIDYGYPRAEYYHPQRREGTLACHYRHRGHPDPLALTGLQDITAHVEYTSLAEAGVEAGLTVAGFASQADFLLGNGLLDELAAGGGDWDRLSRTSEAKRLVLPGLMGEAFKVLALTRGLDLRLSGFALRDRRARLGAGARCRDGREQGGGGAG